jgi:hypothetical protein
MSGFFKSDNWNENNLNPLSRINWRASLVPAAAVIPAPIAYTKVVAVKKLVVGFLEFKVLCVRLARGCNAACLLFWDFSARVAFTGRLRVCPSFTVSKIECSKQAYAVEYISME